MADQDQTKTAPGLQVMRLVKLTGADAAVQVNKWNFSTVMAVADVIRRAMDAESAADKDAAAKDPMGWIRRLIGRDGRTLFDILKLSVHPDHVKHVHQDMEPADAFELIEAMEELNRGSGPLIKKASGLPGQFVGLLGDSKATN